MACCTWAQLGGGSCTPIKERGEPLAKDLGNVQELQLAVESAEKTLGLGQ